MINKLKGKIFLLILLFLFGITSVEAATKNIEVKDISVKDKSGTITVVDPVLVSNEVTSNITFNQKDDFVTFELTLKNNESEKYKISSVTDNNTNENIKTEYSFNEDYMNTGDTSKVTIKLTYKKQLLNVDQISLNDLTIKIALVNEDGESEDIIINPTTGDNIFHYLVLLIIALAGILLIIFKKTIFRLKIGKLLVLLAIVLIPFAAIAKEQYEINIKFNDIIVKGEFETYSISIDPKNGDAPTVKDITYGQQIGALPANPSKDGYNFEKWVDGNGNEVTPDTVITSEISIEAKYSIIEYNITYDLSDGSLPSGKTNPSKYTIETDDFTLNNPTLAGYTFTGWTGTGLDTQTTSVTVAKGSKDARSYTAHYSANDDTEYKVTHRYATLTGDYESETITEHGTTGTTVPAPRQARTGFETPEVQNVKITGDGQASVTYTYERETYAFSITDRTYIDESVTTENETYPYGTTITIKALERPGYGFEWSDGNSNYERTFELEGTTSLTPIYTADTNTPYVVKHYKQKLTLDGYEIADTQELDGTTDSPISPAVNTYTGFTSPEVQHTTIGGDGHTLVEYYYDREMYTLSFNNNENVTSTKAAGSYPYGTQVTLTANTIPGYTFTKWSNDVTTNPYTFTLTGTLTIEPEYTANTNTPYIVEHKKQNLDDLTKYTIADTDNLSGTTDSPITPAVKTYEGFTAPSTQSTTISGNGDTKVEYLYTRNQYTLTITHPEYLEEDKSGDYYYEEQIILTAIDRQGYTFAGWSTGENTKTITVTMPVDGITVEPLYTANNDTTYSVTHRYRKLTTEEDYDVVVVGGTGTTGETIPAPLRPQTGFVTPQSQNITIAATGDASVTYTYQRKTYSFNIADRTYLDESVSTQNDTYPYGTTITLKATARDGYTFKWSDDVTNLERTFELIENVTTLSLVYTPNTYTLTANAHEGTITETEGWEGTGTTATKTITYDSTYGTLPTVERTGYTLAGWNTAEDGTGTNITSATTVSTLTNQNIYAQWLINSYTVSFNTDGGGIIPSQTINHGGRVTRPSTNPEKEGYEFNGWYTTDEYETEFDFENTPITSDTTIYAEFIEIDLCAPFATDSWSTIKSNIESDSDYYPIGCTKVVEIDMDDDNTPESYTVRLSNTSSPSVCSTSGYSQTACGTVIEFVNVIDMMQMNSSNTNAGGWKSAEIATYLNSEFYNKLPSDLKAVMIPTYPIVSGSGSGNDSPNVGAEDINVNKLYLLSLKEAGIDYFYDNKKDVTTDTRILDFYTQNTDKESKIKTDINNAAKIWWTRSASSENTFYFLTVTANGNNGGSAASTSQGVAPAFRIGTMPEFTVTFNTTGSGSSVDSQTITYGESAIRPSTNPTPPSGKIFYNWYTDDSYTTVFDFTKPITGDTTIYARFDVDCLGFDTASWSTIKTNIENDSDYYPIGCQKEVEMDIDEDGVDESYTVRLANTSTPEVCSTEGYSQTACGTVIEFVDIAGTYVWNVTNTAAGGWKNSAIASYLNSDFYNKLPSDLKAVMKPTYPIVSGSCNDNNSPDITVEDTNLNKLYLLSAREVGYNLSSDNKKNVLTDTRTLDYYEINSGEKDKQKQLDGTNETWWLRTPTKNALAICNGVYSSGTSVQDYCRKEHGIAPAFRIGTVAPSKYTVSFDTDGGSEVSSQTVSSGGTVTRPATDPEKTGFVFDDWYTTDQYTTKYDFTTPITGDTTIYAKFDEDLCRGFATDTWSTISSNIETNPNYYPLGCTKEVEIDMNDDSTPESYTVRLSNTSTPTVCQTSGYSQTACGTVIEFIDTIESRKMNTSNTNEGGWAGTDMVTYLNSDFYNKLPSDLKSVIIPTYPIVSGGGSTNNSPDITESDTTKNKIYLLSGREVGLELFGDSKKDITTDTRILDYYYENNSDEARIKRNLYTLTQIWWIRTAHSSYENRFYNIDMDGSCNSTAASYTSGVAPVFRIGKNTYTVEFNANGGTVTNPTKEVIKGEEIGTLPTPTPATGKIFDKWYTGIDSGVEVTSTYQVNNNITIYARYTNQEFTVTFDTDGGSEVSSQTVSSGSTATRPTNDPEKTGYVFDDWYTTDQYTTKYDFTTPITGDTTIYAKFDELKTCAENENITRLSENTCSANENITVGDGIVCKRAVKLHEETCSQTDGSKFCSGAGYTPSGSKGTDTITYGSCGTSGTLTNGDAFTCDVNGDGDFDELTERFYYISDYYNTSTKEFDDSTAVLIYYNNVTDGVSCNKNTYAYDSNNDNWKGPRTLTLQLPTTSQWSNVSLKSTSRQILTNLNTTSTSGGALPEFDYSGYAARFITAQELNSACGMSVGGLNNGELDSCNYVLENTKYAKAAVGNNGYWLESTYQDDNHVVWRTTANKRYVFYDDASYAVNSGARPVIEVPKTAIDIGSLPQYTVSFNSDGGSTIADIEVDAGDSINELPTPTKTDSVFVGWFESVTDETPVPTPYTPSGDITLIAKWNNIICKKATTLHTETCNQTDGSKYCSGDGYAVGDTITYGNIVSSDTYEAGDAFDCDVDGTGYNQRFYYLRTNDNKAVLISNKNFTAASKQDDQNISFIYSQAHDQLPTTSDWGNLPVKFDGKPARLITMEDLLTVTGASDPSDITPVGSLKGYEFLFESSNFSGIGERSTQWLEEISSTERYRYRNDQYNLAQVEAGKENTSKNPVRPVIEVPTDLIEDAYIVKFNANGGDSTTEYVKVIKGSSLGTLPTATREGHIFDGWYTSLDFTIPVTENTVPNGYVTYYAKWTGDIQDATFAHDSFILSVGDEDDIVINNSSDFESVTYTSNDTSIVTVNNSGHLTAIDDGETTITVTGSKSGHTRTINVKVTEEITDFVVHFDSMGGSSVDDMFVPINTAIGSLPEDPELADNIFAGWYTNTNYSTKVTTDTVIRSDVIFYAKWIPENAVAEINHTYFTSLQSAFDSEMTGKTTIILLKDISVQNTYLNLYTKNIGKDIVLDLNNKTITGSGKQTLRTKTSLEIKNGTITQSSSNGTIDVGEGGHLIMNNGTIVNSGSRAAIYNEGGIVELGGTVNATSNAQWVSNNQRGTVQNKAGTTIITGGTYINTRSSDSYAVSASAGTLTIGTKDDIYNTTNIVLQGETSGIYSAVDYSIYDGMIRGKSSAVNDESKITSIEDNATKVNDVDGSYNILYYTVPNNKYRIDLDAGEGTVNPTYILIDAGDQIGTLPTPTRGVYTFDGWFDSNDVEADPTHQPTSSETYYAKWHYEASNEIVEFRTTNDAMKTYYTYIDTWKSSSSNFPSWSSSNNAPNWALDATENTPMKNNFDANNCQCADGQCSSSGTVACDKPKGYSTGLSEKVNVYLSDAVTKAKGDLVTYANSNNGVIYNLIPGQVYYWEAESDENVHGYVKFTGERRILDTGDVRNTRDLGGLPVDTDGDNIPDGELKYGKLFRGIKLSSASSVTELANLGITEELDLRNASDADANKLSDITGKKYHQIETQNYYINPNTQSSTELTYYGWTRAAVKYAMEEIVNGESLYFHCRIGTDRTGTVAYILEGLLGVPEEDRIQDYELSFFYGLIRIHRYHDQKPGSSVGTGHERFVYMHNFMPDNDDIYDWYMAGTTNQQQDEDLIAAFRAKMINSY